MVTSQWEGVAEVAREADGAYNVRLEMELQLLFVSLSESMSLSHKRIASISVAHATRS